MTPKDNNYSEDALIERPAIDSTVAFFATTAAHLLYFVTKNH